MKPSTIDLISKLYIRYPVLDACDQAILQALDILAACFGSGGKLMVCGNGGSAADAQHIVGELMKSFVLARRPDPETCEKIRRAFPLTADYLTANLQGALPAVSLVGEAALNTAYANDVAPDLVFAQQVYGCGRAGDVLMAISTSGNSKNVMYAAQVACAKGIKVIGLTGEGGGRLRNLCCALIAVPSRETYCIQEYHLPIYHALCLALENEFFGE